jgi:hypothetical protein
VVREVAIRGEVASARRSQPGYRLSGWLAGGLGLTWLGVNWVRGGASLISWSLEQTALPMVLIAGGALFLRESASEHLEFDRVKRTVRRFNGFRDRIWDLNRVDGLMANHAAMRDWLRRYWRAERMVSWQDWMNRLSSGDMRLLIVVSEVFDETLLAWWLGETLDPSLVHA